MHDQAATVSASICPDEGKELAFGALVSALRFMAARAEEAGGIVGHVKAFAKEGASFAHASVVAADAEPTLEGDPSLSFGEEADIQLVCIVLLVGQEELVSICRRALREFA